MNRFIKAGRPLWQGNRGGIKDLAEVQYPSRVSHPAGGIVDSIPCRIVGAGFSQHRGVAIPRGLHWVNHITIGYTRLLKLDFAKRSRHLGTGRWGSRIKGRATGRGLNDCSLLGDGRQLSKGVGRNCRRIRIGRRQDRFGLGGGGHNPDHWPGRQRFPPG
jgi:hypothetical protein